MVLVKHLNKTYFTLVELGRHGFYMGVTEG